MADKVYNLIIIGSGPAGYTAGIYASRANLQPLLFEGVTAGGAPGGQLMLTSDVENYPGFPEGIQGPDLMQLMRQQAERFGTTIITEDIVKVDFSKKPFSLVAGDDKTYQAKAVIIATGASAKWLGLASEKQLQGHGVSACATCDGAFFRDQKVVVVGGGDTAMEEALFLTKFASSVTILVRRGEQDLRASKIMIKRAKGHQKISFLWNTEVIKINDPAQNKVVSVTIKNTQDNTVSELATDGVFIAIGHKPNTELFKEQIDLDAQGYLMVSHGSKTNIAGVFGAGDVHDQHYRQAVTAAGSGCAAAIDAERYLAEFEGVETTGGSGWGKVE